MSEKYNFQAEINQLLSLIINTFYSNKDIFLRELISNASDAIDKIRYQSLVNEVSNVNSDFFIKIDYDNENKVLSIEDNGIGMTKTDLINNLGTIAKSGTKSFLEALSETNDINMIGQFGVGFYSAFLIADSVHVISKHNDSDDTYYWESTADGSFEIGKSDLKLTRGTKLFLHVKSEYEEYLYYNKLKSIITKHSNFISYPIKLFHDFEKDVTDSDEEDENINQQENQKKKTKKVMFKEWEQINTQKPIWTRNPEDVTDKEYIDFYRTLTGDNIGNPYAWKHFKVEGNVEFSAILYIPSKTPEDKFNHKFKNGIKLYVKRVFIMDDSRELLPEEYFEFMVGVVDSEDLPLNISREMLQQNRITNTIHKHIVKKSISMMQSLLDDKRFDYEIFWDKFKKYIKLGIVDDNEYYREKLLKLCIFRTHMNHNYTLTEYIQNMPQNQKEIYFLAGENENIVRSSPFLEPIEKLGFDAIYMTDAIDEYIVQRVSEFGGKKMVSCCRTDTKYDDDEEMEKYIKEKTYNLMCDEMTHILHNDGATIQKVVIGNHTVKTPCVIVTGEYGWTGNMERIIRAQAIQNDTFIPGDLSSIYLEINPKHNLIKKLKTMYDSKNKNFKNLVKLIFETTKLNSGYVIKDPVKYSNQIFEIMNKKLIDELE